MSRGIVLARGAVSGLGTGAAAWRVGEAGAVARTAIARDPLLSEAGLARPFAARAPAELGVDGLEDRAAALLANALGQLCDELDAAWADWRRCRVAVAIGTSSGGMLSAEQWLWAKAAGTPVSVELLRRATYFAPYCDALGWVGIDVGDGAHAKEVGARDRAAVAAATRPSPQADDPPRGALRPPAAVGSRWHKAQRVVPVHATQIVAACASSTIAIGLGLRWLARDRCDLVIAGGYDGLSLFVAAGFEAIRATTASSPRPFRLERDGMSLGEGAGVVALAAPGRVPARRRCVVVTGFGASNDAVHITAPDRTGAGLARAACAALREAGPGQVDLVSAHGTSTPYNDAMEAKAIATACGSDPLPLVHPFKAQIGHTLGAAGVLELLAAGDAIERGLAPAAAGEGPIDPEAAVPLLARTEPRELSRALKLSAAFAGVTAALVLDSSERAAADEAVGPSDHGASGRTVRLRAHAHVTEVDTARLVEATGIARDRLGRIDDLGQLALAAVERLVAAVGRDAVAGAGVVMGHALATLDVNERFHARLRGRGPRFVDPRLFPATTPNAAAGHCAIAFGLTGPNFAVNAGLGGGLEALAIAAELVAASDVDRMIVVAADDAGPLGREWVERLGLQERALARGAVALLIDAAVGGASTDRHVLPEMPIDQGRGPIGHLGLLEWLAG